MCLCLCWEEDKVVPIGLTCRTPGPEGGQREREIARDAVRQRGMELCIAILPLQLLGLYSMYRKQRGAGFSLYTHNTRDESRNA